MGLDTLTCIWIDSVAYSISCWWLFLELFNLFCRDLSDNTSGHNRNFNVHLRAIFFFLYFFSFLFSLKFMLSHFKNFFRSCYFQWWLFIKLLFLLVTCINLYRMPILKLLSLLVLTNLLYGWYLVFNVNMIILSLWGPRNNIKAYLYQELDPPTHVKSYLIV